MKSTQSSWSVLIVLSMMTNGSLSVCKKGCSVCDPEAKQCRQCDYKSFFFPTEDSQCQVGLIKHCLATDMNSNCVKCDSKTFLFQGKCFEIATPIENCAEYSSAIACKTCNLGMLLKDSLCVDIPLKIANCSAYSPDGLTCTDCQHQFVPSHTGTKCVKVSEVPNCQSYTNLQCLKCQPGYLSLASTYQHSVGKLREVSAANRNTPESSLLTKVFSDLIETTFNNKTASYFSSCIKAKVSNCQVFEAFDKCKACQSQFYLDFDKTCKPFPKTAIQNCQDYKDLKTCKLCSEDFYLASNGSCVAVTPIDNCVRYDSLADGVCLKCKDAFYSRVTSCVLRTQSISIDNCVEKDPAADKCLSCLPSLTLSFSGLECVTGILNCLVHQALSTGIRCKECAKNFFPTGPRCQLSVIPNCVTVTGEESCGLCQDGYYLLNQVCSPHTLTKFLRCKTMSDKVLNRCLECFSDGLMGVVGGVCLPVPKAINNCIKYVADRCVECDTRVSYLRNDICYSVYIENCLDYHHDIARSCKLCLVDDQTGQGYVVDQMDKSNNSCVPANPNPAFNCNRVRSVGSEIGCDFCEGGYYPMKLESALNAFCVPRDFFRFKGRENQIVGCLVYDFRISTCVVCQTGSVVDSTGFCVSECSADSHLTVVQFESVGGEEPSLTGLLKCLPNSSAPALPHFTKIPFGCYLYAESALAKGTFFCAGCRRGQVPVVLLTQPQDQVVNSRLDLPDGRPRMSADSRVASVNQCVSRTTTMEGSTNALATLVALQSLRNPLSFDNCRYAINYGAYLGCGNCNFGFSGPIVADFQNRGYFVSNCRPTPGCEADKYLSGLGSFSSQVRADSPPLDFFVTCHACTDGNIPTFVRSSSAITVTNKPGVKQGFYGEFNFPNKGVSTEPYKEASATSQNGDAASCQPPGLKYSFVSNCAVQEVLIDKVLTDWVDQETPQPLPSALNPICHACAPGFFPVFFDQSTVIQKCLLIFNCNSQAKHSFNRCGICNTNFAFVYDETAPDGLSLYQECFAMTNSDSNCFIFDKATGKCTHCKPGHLLNRDDFCDRVEMFDCQTPGPLSPLTLNAYLSLALFGSGCQECSGESIAVRETFAMTLCVKSISIEVGQRSEASKFIIDNCLYYGFSQLEDVVCVKCSDGFVQSVTQTKCFPSNPKINNCEVYNREGTKCAKCRQGYFANADSNCQLGSVANCVVYKTEVIDSCELCTTGFVVVLISASKGICVEEPKLNCLEFAESEELGSDFGTFKCKRCKEGFNYVTDTDLLGSATLSICVSAPKVDNCVEYDNDNGLFGLSQGCKLCEPEWFARGGKCVKRNNLLIANCEKLSVDSDSCAKCSSGYLMDELSSCQPFPSGVSGCIEYRSSIACSLCDTGMFLTQNRCQKVPADEVVSLCKYYDSNKNCLLCKEGHLLNGPNTCTKQVATNCLTFADPNNCLTCPVNFGLVKSATGTICAEMRIDDCLEPDLESKGPDFKCSVCQTSFYLDGNGKCSAVSTNIPNCYLYESATKCSRCFPGLALGPLKTECVKVEFVERNIDPYCQFSVITEETVCNACAVGYSMRTSSDGKTFCVACGDELNCLTCNPNDLSECFSCKVGFSQNENGECLRTYQTIKFVSGEMSVGEAVWRLFVILLLVN
jgi:hypothetical protein